ncbi:MFS transporter [Comamonas kerstersii]|uniref:MFS transporter n=1 Tax=Comamonas kerstersii TaxID=225992 RepID=UPI001B32331A|nr:MFS transporter [Comamonas kerstersii]QTW18874.1 MFS transporter [Comamonas kerstersii]
MPSPTPKAQPTVLAAPALLLMALACGLCAGGNYFNQALLHSIALHFDVDDAAAGLSVTVAQVAYAVGLLFITPLGDKFERRRMAVVLMLLAAAGHALVGWSQSFAMFMAGTLIAGLFSVAAQVLVPMAAALAAPGHAGRNVGLVLSGLLVGILLSRSVAGGLSAIGGWSLVYQVTAVAMVLMALWLRRALPTSRHPQPMPYTQVLRSMGQLLRTQPALRLRTTASALAFASVSVMFATMALVLSSAPLHLSDAQIGLVGLAGVTGALIANMAGSWADKGKGNALLRLGAVTLLLSWWLLWQGQSSVWWFVAGVLVMDLGLQAINVTNQSSVASLLPEARSRMNAVYMTGYFAGASAGSALGVWAWNLAGWQGACSVGAGLALLAAISVWCGVRWSKKQQSAAVQRA